MSTEATQSSALDTLGSETRTFPPPVDFVRQATATDPARDEAGGTAVAVLGAATLENMISRGLASHA